MRIYIAIKDGFSGVYLLKTSKENVHLFLCLSFCFVSHTVNPMFAVSVEFNKLFCFSRVSRVLAGLCFLTKSNF